MCLRLNLLPPRRWSQLAPDSAFVVKCHPHKPLTSGGFRHRCSRRGGGFQDLHPRTLERFGSEETPQCLLQQSQAHLPLHGLDSERVLSESSAELSGDLLRGTVVILRQATQAQVSANRTVDRHLPERLTPLVTDALMVSVVYACCLQTPVRLFVRR